MANYSFDGESSAANDLGAIGLGHANSRVTIFNVGKGAVDATAESTAKGEASKGGKLPWWAWAIGGVIALALAWRWWKKKK